ncbi:MAG: type II/IV secretion system protein [Bdellovibrionales bacterium]|nr:type II/IV secretion system protein [Bdellovibrionales bacterium]
MSWGETLIKFLEQRGLLLSPVDHSAVIALGDCPLRQLNMDGLVDEALAIKEICNELHIEYCDLQSEVVATRLNLKQFRGRINSRVCWKQRMVPIAEDSSSVTLVMANPFDMDSRKAIEFAVSKPVNVLIAEESRIISLLARYFPIDEIDEETLNDSTADKITIEGIQDHVERLDATDVHATPVVRLVNKILADAIRVGASDVHLEPSELYFAVRFRVDGMMQDIISLPKKVQANVTGRFKILANMDIAERRRPQDGRIRVSLDDRQIDMRVSTIPASSGEKVVLRVLQADYSSMNFDHLGLPTGIRERFQRDLHRKGKLLLVSGPTGAGKTTTLYVALNYLNDGTMNITTIEDPIEYKFEHINQVQVNNAANVGFASVLRSVLRQDPDVVMIGEIRDEDTLKVVLQAAQTGHLVISTVHTNDAPAAINRLLDLGAERFHIATTLAGVMAQRLVRGLCQNCAVQIPERALSRYTRYVDAYEVDVNRVKVGSGCEVCRFTGYKGRIAIYSYLQITDEVSQLIHEGASQDKIVAAARKGGFRQLDDEAIELLHSGRTTFEEIVSYLEIDKQKAVSEPIPLTIPVPQSHIPIQPTVSQPHELRIHLDTGQAIVPSQGSAPPSRALHRRKVLVIDDNKSVRKMLIALLKKEAVAVDEAANGIEGLERLYDELPDLIVCDIQMPEMNGVEFLERVKSDKQFRDIPVIMLTVDDGAENESALIRRGAHDFLSKRDSPLVMVSRIRRLLGEL